MATKLIIPPLGESISEATLVKWLKQVGDPVSMDEPVAELETDKITVSLPASQAGILTEQTHKVGSVVRIGESIGIISSEVESGKPSKPPVENPAATASQTTSSKENGVASEKKSIQEKEVAPEKKSVEDKVSPSIASVANLPNNKKQVDSLKGPALPPSQRQALREGHTLAKPSTAPLASTSQVSTLASSASSGREEQVPISPLRKRIAERLVLAQHTAAILTTFNEADMSKIIDLRTQYQEAFTKKHGIKLGFMSFFVKACAESLKIFPGLNAEMRGDHIVYKKYYDFGIAVGSGKGLVVPVIRNVDKLSLAEIEKAISNFAQKAKENKLTLDDLSGGTFSITNGGIYGSMMSTPLLNLPQTGILGMHNIIKRPIAFGDQVVIRPMMYLALSYDHRVVDGREAVQFLVQVKELLEQPEKLLLGI